ncbi:NAD-dependent epimerase/dehydratase family protein [Selenomonas sp. TAMA-11512]|uniref:NAD-dependent epimerase/dehydratase family protein n=1 Tax=Selenomonas sp. TAMA-11512 TaxID=3095337 RepID=UPI00308E5407|nr:NAD-dependent epimerase/dehydratase family protein [Selenomonas sp. TAMA-11512]
MKVLVTGGAGFIGSHLVEKLMEKGVEVAVLDNLSSGIREHVPAGIEFFKLDIQDENLKNIVRIGRYDAVVHLAGQTMVDVSIKQPLYDVSENIAGTVSVLEAARIGDVPRVIFASTAAVYGNVREEELPIQEARQLAPMSFYGLSKETVERYLALYQETFGIDYVVLRFANVYGERQGDGGEGGVISIFTKAIAEGRDITIFGDGEQTRDFIYAGDIAEGICRALSTKEVNAAYNLSTQSETSLRMLVSELAKIADRDITPKYAKEREGDIYKSMLSNERARRGLRWEPKVTLTEGLKRTYAYFLEK